MAVFIISRLLVYPRYLVWPAINHIMSSKITIHKILIGIALIALQIMHVVWTRSIVMIMRRLMNGEKIKNT